MNRTFVSLLSLLSFGMALTGRAEVIETKQAVIVEIKGVPSTESQQVNGTYPVADDGTIRMPYIGSIRAAGLTQNQLAANIEAAYKSSQIYRTPTINVIANKGGGTVAEATVTIGGQVRRTGQVPWNKNMTLYQAIQVAGGETEFGSLRRVQVIRGANQQEYNLEKNEFKNLLLENGDTVVVPQKRWTE